MWWPTVPTKLSLARVVKILDNDEITAYYSYIASARDQLIVIKEWLLCHVFVARMHTGLLCESIIDHT